MKAGAHPALAVDTVRYVGDHVAIVIAETHAHRQRRGRTGQGRVRRAARRHRPGQGASRRRAANPRRGAAQHDLSMGDRQQARDRGRVQEGGAHRQAEPHQQPADPERDGAARGGRRLRRRHRRLHSICDEPEPARRAPGDVGLHRHRPRAQAARRGARRRRRLRLEDLHLRRGGRLHLGREESEPPGQMDGRALGIVSLRRPWPRSRDRAPNSRSTPTRASWAFASRRSRTSAPICRRSRRPCRPISTARCCPANTTSPPSIARSMRSTPTPRPSTPIAAPAAPKRPSSSSASSKKRRAS